MAPYPAGMTRDILHSERFPNFASDLAKGAAKTLASLGLRSGDVFLKFGKRAYTERLHDSGTLRIQPASYFARKDHNGAIRDDELQFNFSGVLSRDEIVKLVRDPQGRPPDFPPQRADMSFKFPTDYWIY